MARYPCSEFLEQRLISEFLECAGSAALPMLAPDGPCTICSSSGMIGAPKGIVLSHMAMLTGTCPITCSVTVTDAILHLSHLPIAHVRERLTLTVITDRGGRIVFATKRSIRPFADVKLLRATVGPMIPSLLEQLYAKITSEGGMAMKLALGLSRICRRFGFRCRIADALAFNTVRPPLGGPLEWFVVAGSSFHRTIHEGLSAIFNIELVTIYGLSEAGGAVSITDRHSVEPGTVGQLAPGTQLRFSASG